MSRGACHGENDEYPSRDYMDYCRYQGCRARGGASTLLFVQTEWNQKSEPFSLASHLERACLLGVRVWLHACGCGAGRCLSLHQCTLSVHAPPGVHSIYTPSVNAAESLRKVGLFSHPTPFLVVSVENGATHPHHGMPLHGMPYHRTEHSKHHAKLRHTLYARTIAHHTAQRNTTPLS